jgi:hypothetical protein
LNYLVAVYLILAGLLGIGLIATPLRAHAQFDHGAPASAVGDCRPAADVAATSIPANIAHDGQRETRLSATPSRGAPTHTGKRPSAASRKIP